MDEIQIFQNEEFGRIRTVVINGETWFCGRDVCNALGYSNGRDAIRRHCNPKGVVNHDTPTKSGSQMMTYINEPNLYRLVAHSKLEGAIRFENWIFEEVLPEIKKDLTKSPLCAIMVIVQKTKYTRRALPFLIAISL